MKKNHVCVRYVLVLLLLIAGFSGTGVCDYRIVSTVQKVFKTYNMSIDENQISIMPVSDTTKAMTVSVRSKRNSFEMVMLISFIASGWALKDSDEPIDEVSVVVIVPYKEDERIYAKANRESVVRLVRGEIKTADFIRDHVTW